MGHELLEVLGAIGSMNMLIDYAISRIIRH